MLRTKCSRKKVTQMLPSVFSLSHQSVWWDWKVSQLLLHPYPESSFYILLYKNFSRSILFHHQWESFVHEFDSLLSFLFFMMIMSFARSSTTTIIIIFIINMIIGIGQLTNEQGKLNLFDVSHCTRCNPIEILCMCEVNIFYYYLSAFTFTHPM